MIWRHGWSSSQAVERGTAVDLGETTATVGRNPDCTIAVSANEVLVSANHATLTYQDGTFVLSDDGSRNGTFVNGEKITEARVLQHNDLVQFGAGGPGVRFVIGPDASP